MASRLVSDVHAKVNYLQGPIIGRKPLTFSKVSSLFATYIPEEALRRAAQHVDWEQMRRQLSERLALLYCFQYNMKHLINDKEVSDENKSFYNYCKTYEGTAQLDSTPSSELESTVPSYSS